MANVEWEGPKQVPPIPDASGHRIHFTVGNDYARFSTPDWEVAKESERDALEAERDRLLYVAVTRARDHLVLPVCHDREQAKGFLSKMSPALPGIEEKRWGEEVADTWQFDTRELDAVAEHPPEVLYVDPDAPPDESAVQRRGEILAELDVAVRAASRGIQLVTASGMKSEMRPLVAESEAADSNSDDQPPSVDTEDAPPLEFGDAFHRVMELVDLPDLVTLEPLATAICEEHGIPDSAGAIVAMGRLVRDAIQGEGISRDHREVPFVVPCQSEVLIGRIDLVARVGDEVDVIDFKTDQREIKSLPHAIEDHRGQLETYRQSVTLATTKDATVKVIFARTGEIVTVG
jgi:ATP-dependent exoDNAse (exonuclease V) beta subunit